MRYNRANLQDTGRVAMALAKKSGKVQYVVSTAFGFTISDKPADFGRQCKATDGDKVWTVGDK